MMDKFKPKSKKFPEEVAESIARVQEVDFSLWNSPIQLIETVPRTTYEDGIFNAVKEVGVVVDKERLLMVLQNDRASYADGYQAGLEAAQPKWISVEERLPDVVAESNWDKRTEYVLAIEENGSFHVGRFYIYKFDGNYEFVSGYERPNVTHWMNLPEPPKEATND